MVSFTCSLPCWRNSTEFAFRKRPKACLISGGVFSSNPKRTNSAVSSGGRCRTRAIASNSVTDNAADRALPDRGRTAYSILERPENRARLPTSKTVRPRSSASCVTCLPKADSWLVSVRTKPLLASSAFKIQLSISLNLRVLPQGPVSGHMPSFIAQCAELPSAVVQKVDMGLSRADAKMEALQ